IITVLDRSTNTANNAKRQKPFRLRKNLSIFEPFANGKKGRQSLPKKSVIENLLGQWANFHRNAIQNSITRFVSKSLLIYFDKSYTLILHFFFKSYFVSKEQFTLISLCALCSFQQ